MKTVPVETLQEGAVAGSDFYSDKGSLLISKGVVINSNHLTMLHQRNVFELYVKPVSEDEVLHTIINKKFKSLGNVDIDDQTTQKNPIFKRLKPGREGLLQLNRSEKAFHLDKKLGSTSDRPIGPALRNKATQLSVTDRTDGYKTGISEGYRNALKEVKYILDKLANGGTIDGMDIAGIVQNFEKIFITDKNILLNISGIKHTNAEFIYHHSLNVCLLTINIAAAAGYNESQVQEIGMGALLHDVGMLLIPSEIRVKDGRLTPEEWFEVQKHPILGLHLIEKVSNLPESIPYVSYQVHERENSTGYPKQRNSLLIHRFAKLVQVADIYEALTSARSYRKAYIPHEGIVRLIKMSKAGMIPGEFVKSFIEYTSLYPVGSLVELSDRRIAKVIESNRTSLGKPVVSVLTDTSGNPLEKGLITQIDLLKNTWIQITKSLPSDYLQGCDVMDGF
jgi:HD-GYP domain-containing protein (c-di-GMP phosphodiesterase class II)